MDDPLSICVNASAHIAAGLKAHSPNLRFWHSMNQTSGLSASLELYVSDQQPPAFASVTIHCFIPTDSFGTRRLSLQTHSLQWSEHDYPSIGFIAAEIPAILAEEEKKLGYAPRFALATTSGTPATKDLPKELQIKFGEVSVEVNVADDEAIDYETVAAHVLQELVSICRVLNRIRKLSEAESGQ